MVVYIRGLLYAIHHIPLDWQLSVWGSENISLTSMVHPWVRYATFFLPSLKSFTSEPLHVIQKADNIEFTQAIIMGYHKWTKALLLKLVL